MQGFLERLALREELAYYGTDEHSKRRIHRGFEDINRSPLSQAGVDH